MNYPSPTEIDATQRTQPKPKKKKQLPTPHRPNNRERKLNTYTHHLLRIKWKMWTEKKTVPLSGSVSPKGRAINTLQDAIALT